MTSTYGLRASSRPSIHITAVGNSRSLNQEGHCATPSPFGLRKNYAKKQMPKNLLVALGFMPEINTRASTIQ